MTEFHASDLIGDYRLEARLGQGGFGTVWRARHINTGRVVAVKVLPENENIQDSAKLRADVELLAASAAGSSNHIVQVLDGGISPVPYVVMEFIAGSSLGEELKSRGKVTQAETIDIGLGIADALDALQDVGIVHRDVKPSNVLIDRHGTVKLTDFGIAKIAGYDAVTVTGQLPLSIAYAAPEVWEGKAEHRSDLYALGVLLYQCLTGTPPFRGAYAELFYQHRSREPDLTALPVGTAPSLADLISHCLRKEPADRPESAAVCRNMLLQARQEMAMFAPDEETQAEPARLGPWIKGEPHPTQPWAWQAKNAETGQEAVVEVHFAATAEYGEALRRAVAASEQLAPLGAERVIQTNRMILRPGEAWQNPPHGQFQFWVAREEIALPEPLAQIGASALLGYTNSLEALISESQAAGVALHLTPENIVLLPDGSVYMRRPGLDVGYEGDPQRDALAMLRKHGLTRDVRPLVVRARSLADLRTSLERLLALRAAEAAGEIVPLRNGRKRALIGAALATTVAVIAAALFVFLPSSEEEPPPENVVAESPTVTIPVPVTNSCLDLNLPAPIAAAEAACATGGVLAFDPVCATGFACNRVTREGAVAVGINDRSVLFIDAEGWLTRARENGLEPERIVDIDNVEEMSWSPDGRLVAYLTRQSAGGDAISTQLWVIEPGRAANRGLVLGTNDLEGRATRRLISAIQWSPDSHALYFLWSVPNEVGNGDLFRVDLPLTGAGEVDIGRLRIGGLPDETSLYLTLNEIEVAPEDFDVPDGYFTNLRVMPDGAFLLQICEGLGVNRSCGIGSWTGEASFLLPLERGVAYGPPLPSPFDGVLHTSRFENGAWGLIRIENGAAVDVPGITFLGTSAASPPGFALTRQGDALLFQTEPGLLALVAYDGTGLAIWGPGSHPQWFVPGAQPPATPLPLPPASIYRTPVATVTPAPTATATIPPQMQLLVTVFQGGAAVSGARVTAMINDIECATALTGVGATALQFPSASAPAGCRQPGATVRFFVNGAQVSDTITYMPGASFPFPITAP